MEATAPIPVTAPVETPAAPEGTAPAPAPVVETASRAFSAVARREKALQRQREDFKAKETAIAAKEAALTARLAELEKIGVKPSSPMEALSRFGYNYKDATEFALNEGQPTADFIARESKEDVAALRRELAERDEAEKQRQIQAAEVNAQETIAEFNGEIKEFVKENSETYELIALHDAQNLVYDVCEEYFLKHKRVLDIKTAADAVEEHLDKQAQRLLSTRKMKARLGTPAAPAAKQPGDTGQDTGQPRRTLTNGLTPSTPTFAPSNKVQDDAMRRALAALGG